jgi:hypothetical protein
MILFVDLINLLKLKTIRILKFEKANTLNQNQSLLGYFKWKKRYQAFQKMPILLRFLYL